MPNTEHLSVIDLAQDLSKVEGLPCGQIPGLLTQLSALQTAMAMRLITGGQSNETSDTLLTVDEAATRLGVSTDWLYRRTNKLGFVVRVGRRVRFSSQGIDRYVKRQTGR